MHIKAQSRFINYVKGNVITKGFNKSWGNKNRNDKNGTDFRLEDVLIRKRAETLPANSSGYCVRVPSVFLFMLSDGAEIRGKLKQGEEEREVTLILERASCDDFLHIAAVDWADTITEGRANFKLTEALQNGRKTQLYEKRSVITSPAQSCKISPKR